MDSQNTKIFLKGNYVYIVGDENSDEIYIVENGEIEIQITNERYKKQKKVAKAGDIIGFISSLCKRPRIESAQAKVDTKVCVFTKETFLSLMVKNNDIALKVLNNFADDLRFYIDIIYSNEDYKIKTPNDIRLKKLADFYFEKKIFQNAYYIYEKYLQLYKNNENIGEIEKKLNDIQNKDDFVKNNPQKIDKYIKYNNNQIVFCENEPGNELYVIKKGKIKIIKVSDNNEVILSILKEGDVFGELAIASDKPRNATAISYGETTLIPISKDTLIKFISNSPDLLNKIYTSISQRIWFTYIRFDLIVFKKPITKCYVYLENTLIEQKISLNSKYPYNFRFGLKELLKMVNVNHDIDTVNVVLNEFLKDKNIKFNFGQINVLNISKFYTKVKFYRSRDHLLEKK